MLSKLLYYTALLAVLASFFFWSAASTSPTLVDYCNIGRRLLAVVFFCKRCNSSWTLQVSFPINSLFARLARLTRFYYFHYISLLFLLLCFVSLPPLTVVLFLLSFVFFCILFNFLFGSLNHTAARQVLCALACTKQYLLSWLLCIFCCVDGCKYGLLYVFL